MKYSLLCFILCCTTSVYSQSNVPGATQEKIDRLFEKVNDTTPGYVVGVIRDQEFIVQKGYGSAHLEHKIPITSETVFNIASLSKQFTAACIAMLILDDKLSLDDLVARYIPNFPKYLYDVRIKHLIYMTSGITEYYETSRTNGTDWSSLHFFNIDTAISASLSIDKLMYQPGTQWSYSNVNYMLLTQIVEAVADTPFAQFAKEMLFEPLGMKHTCVNDDIFQVIPHRALGYNDRSQENIEQLTELGYLSEAGEGFLQIHRNSPHYGGSGVYTSLEDFKKWIDNFETRVLGGDDFYHLMHKRMPFSHDKTNDALGLVFGDYNGHEMIWYEGGDWGYSSYMMRFPQDKVTIICLSNLGEGNAANYARQVMDILIEDEIVTLN